MAPRITCLIPAPNGQEQGTSSLLTRLESQRDWCGRLRAGVADLTRSPPSFAPCSSPLIPEQTSSAPRPQVC